MVGLIASAMVGFCCDDTPSTAEPALTDAGPSAQWESLVETSGWRVTAPVEDPWRHERPADFECPDWALRVEPAGFEVNTGDCDYLVVQQPSLAAIEEGDEITLIFRHDGLVAPTDAMAHVAFSVGDHPLWETTTPIPAVAQAFTPTLVSDFAAPVGTPIYLHLHNHGANDWVISALERRPPASGGNAP
jgi:hypothetical protein